MKALVIGSFFIVKCIKVPEKSRGSNLALMEAVSPDLKKQGYLAVVFVIGNIADSRTKFLFENENKLLLKIFNSTF